MNEFYTKNLAPQSLGLLKGLACNEYVCAWVLLCQSMCVAWPASMQGQLVIYTLFTDTQFTTKTKQINIRLNSLSSPSLGATDLLTSCG